MPRLILDYVPRSRWILNTSACESKLDLSEFKFTFLACGIWNYSVQEVVKFLRNVYKKKEEKRSIKQ